jgi:hypothetical protein
VRVVTLASIAAAAMVSAAGGWTAWSDRTRAGAYELVVARRTA